MTKAAILDDKGGGDGVGPLFVLAALLIGAG
jgi:hypothetical protein